MDLIKRKKQFGNRLPNPADIIIPLSWVNFAFAGYDYETLAISGSNITSAINSSGEAFVGAVVNFLQGTTYRLSINLTLNSGQAPTLKTGTSADATLGDISQELVSGVNEITVTIAGTSANNTHLWVSNTGLSDWSATVSVVEPRGLLFRALVSNGLVDDIGLSISDYLSIRAELRPIFFIDADTKNDDATIITNIEASEYLNNGGELGGSAEKGYFLYPESTAEEVLRRAYRWAGVTYVPPNPEPLPIEFSEFTAAITTTPTIAAAYSEIDTLLSDNTDWVGIDVGTTYAARTIRGVIINPTGYTRTVLLNGAIHGEEKIGTRVALEFLKYIQLHRDDFAGIRLVVVPMCNPDAYVLDQRKNHNTVDGREVDLNRNFPIGFGRGSSSSDTASIFYKGPSALSELESIALQALVDSYLPDIHIDLHDGGTYITNTRYQDKTAIAAVMAAESAAGMTVHDYYDEFPMGFFVDYSFYHGSDSYSIEANQPTVYGDIQNIIMGTIEFMNDAQPLLSNGLPAQNLVGFYDGEILAGKLVSKLVTPGGEQQRKGTAIRGNGTFYMTIGGLLTTHKISAGSPDVPTCTVNGRLDFAAGVDYWDIQGWNGATKVFEISGALTGNTISERSNIAGLPSGAFVSLVGDPHVQLSDGSGSDHINSVGYIKIQNLIPTSLASLASWTYGGITNASGKLTTTTANVLHYAASGNFTFTSGQKYYLKAKVSAHTARYLKLVFPSAAFPDTGRSVIFDLLNLVACNAEAGVEYSITESAGIISLMISATADATAAGSAFAINILKTCSSVAEIGDTSYVTFSEVQLATDNDAHYVGTSGTIDTGGIAPVGYGVNMQLAPTPFPAFAAGPFTPDFTVTAGTVFPNITVKAPLSAAAQGVAEWSAEAAVDLSTLLDNTGDTTFIGPNGMAVYRVPQNAIKIAKIMTVLGN